MNEPLATVVLVVATVLATLHGWSHQRFTERHLFDSARIRHRREWRRLLTSGFLHADFLHLGFNMLALASFGEAIESAAGAATLLPIYLLGILGGNALALFVHRNHEYRALGASGGVCAVVFATLLYFPQSSVSLLFVPISIPGLLFAPLYLVFSIVGMRKQLGGLGHEAHIGGSVTGLAAAAALHPGAARAGAGTYLAIVALAALVVVLAYGAKVGRWLRRRRPRG